MWKDKNEDRKNQRISLACLISAMGMQLVEQVNNNPQAELYNYRTPTESKNQVIRDTCKQMRLYLNELRKLYE